jgi:hypothetical protein
MATGLSGMYHGAVWQILISFPEDNIDDAGNKLL